MNILEYSAVNVGERELFLGYDEFKKRMEKIKFPLVTANMVIQGTERSITIPYVIKSVKSPSGKSYKIGIIGLTKFNPTFQKSGPEGKNISTISPIDAAKKYIPEMVRKADITIVLAAMSKDEAHLLAREVPGINLILAGYGGILTTGKETEGTTEIIYAGNQGKRMAELRLYMNGDEKIAEVMKHIHYLNKKYPDDPKLLEIVNEALKKVAEINKQQRPKADQTSTQAPVPNFVTSEGCKPCHGPQFEVWENSKHARAFVDIAEKGKGTDQECQRCHVTGFARINGFKNETESAKLLNVQCEACHGAGSLHPEQVRTGYGRVVISTCVSCHSKEWSPNFNYYEYMPRIKH
ncbi:MAG: multiheme c-type cytochrome [Acidobacteriota bacterium]